VHSVSEGIRGSWYTQALGCSVRGHGPTVISSPFVDANGCRLATARSLLAKLSSNVDTTLGLGFFMPTAPNVFDLKSDTEDYRHC
jgi:hypothetical protein